MSSEETKRPNKDFDFSGAWLPSITPLRLGGKNYTSLGNLACDANGLSGLAGYSRITTLVQKTSPLAITALTRAAQCQVTCPGHGIAAAGYTAVFSSIEQTEWSALNDAGHISIISIVDGNNLIIDYNTSAFAAAFVLGTQEPTASFYDPVQYINARSGIHFRPPFTRRSILLVQATNEAETASAVLQQIAETTEDDIPAIKDFDQEVLHTDDPAAGHGRFALWPRGNIAYCNGQESLVYAGPEMNPAKVMITTGKTMPITNAQDVTEALTNGLTNNGFTKRLTAGPDPYTSLLLLFDGNNGAITTIDSSPYEHTVTRVGTGVNLNTGVKKFGTASSQWGANAAGYWRIPTHAKFSFGTENFTVDVQSKIVDYNAHQALAMGYKDANNYWYFDYFVWTEGGIITFLVFKAVASGQTVVSMAWVISPAQRFALATAFRHLEVCRNGNQIKAFYEGNLLTPEVGYPFFQIGNASMPVIDTGYLYVGYNQINGYYGNNAFYDTLRVSTGIARHSESFYPPATAYETGGASLAIFTLRPIQAIKFYLTEVNVVTDAEIQGHVWIGNDYQELAATDETEGMTVNEKSVRFNPTRGTAQPCLVYGNLYYVYIFQLTDGEAELYRVTVDAPIQTIVDLWDGVLRPVSLFRYYKGTKWYDKTLPVAEETPAGAAGHEVYNASVGGMTNAEYIDIYTSERACAFKITMFTREADKINTNSATMSILAWNGTEYFSPPGQFDGTEVSGKTLNQSGFVFYSPSLPGAESKKEHEGQFFWHCRLMFSATLSANVWIDMVQAIPAPQEVKQAYLFPFMFQSRPMLCGNVATGELNRIDYGLAYSTEGWNGEESSNGDGRSPLYIGGTDQLTCACEIYNRLGSSIYTFALMFKAYELYILHGDNHETFKDYPLNNKIGCPAPLTLDTFTISESAESQSARAVACWLSFQGPYMFDAGGITAIKGIECYFDERDPRCINFAAINKSRGWFSGNGRKYNLGIPSGAAATEINTWLIYDFEIKKWYPAVPSAEESPYPAAIVRVSDEYSRQYNYGFRQNGAVMRLENGMTYDGEPIAQHVETGEIIPGSLWQIMKGRFLKVIGLTTEEPDVSLAVTFYKDGDDQGDVIATIPISADREKIFRYTKEIAPGDCTSYRVRIAGQTQASPRGIQLLAWGVKVSDEREDRR